MRIVIQRVLQASVNIDHQVTASIGLGFVVLLGIEEADTREDADWLCNKLINLRVFADAAGQMNCALQEVNGEILLVSQFTLHASTRKGNRPSFIKAARPEQAIPLYEYFIQKTESLLGHKIASGRFAADMQVSLINDGPVTIIIDSKSKE